MSKNEIVAILDRSGSMRGLTDETITGFNGYVEEQRDLDPKTRLTLVLFNQNYDLVYKRKKLSKVVPLDRTVYVPSGSTALLDAIGRTITDLDPESGKKRKGKTIVLIITDGMENASTDYTREAVKELITKCQDKHGWKFLFLGAGIDSFAEAHSIGIPQMMASDYVPSAMGTKQAYAAALSATRDLMNDQDVNLSDTMDEVSK
jgi:hypothetical protein